MRRLVVLLCLVWAGYAEGGDTLTVARLRGGDTDLPQLPSKLWNGELVYENAYLYTLSCVHGFTAYDIGYARLHVGIEGVAGYHRGIQEHLEGAVGLHLRLEGLLPPESPLNLDYGIGDGLSYAFGEPLYEDTPEDRPTKHYRLQNFISMDLDIYGRDFPRLHLLFRLHHRSGIYGLIAPRRVGSNFIGYGVKYLF